MLTEHTRKFSTRSLDEACIAKAAGFPVEVVRQPAGKRCLFYLPEVQRLKDLLGHYQRKGVLNLPAISILQARTALHHEARRVSMEAL